MPSSVPAHLIGNKYFEVCLIKGPALSLLALNSKDTLLEFGCGDGALLMAALDAPTSEDSVAIPEDDVDAVVVNGRPRRASIAKSVQSVFRSHRASKASQRPVLYSRPHLCVGVAIEAQACNKLRRISSEKPHYALHVVEQEFSTVNLSHIGCTAAVMYVSPAELMDVKPALKKWLQEECISPHLVVRSDSSTEMTVLHADSAATIGGSSHSNNRLSGTRSGILGVARSLVVSQSAPDVAKEHWMTQLIKHATSASSTNSQSKHSRRCVSIMFSIPDWTPSKVLQVADEDCGGIWLFYYDLKSLGDESV